MIEIAKYKKLDKELTREIEGWSNYDLDEYDKIFVAWEADNIIGYVTLSDGYVKAIEVMNDYRKQGISLHLLEEAESFEPLENYNPSFWNHIDEIYNN